MRYPSNRRVCSVLACALLLGPALFVKGSSASAATQSTSTTGSVAVSHASEAGGITGIIRDEENGDPLSGAQVTVVGSNKSAVTDSRGRFAIDGLGPGIHSLIVDAKGMRRTRVTDVFVQPGDRVMLQPVRLAVQPAGVPQRDDFVVSARRNDGVLELDPFEVSSDRPKPFADGNIDLPRTIDDAQPYYIFDWRTIERSGAPSLENFIRERIPMATGASSQDQSVFIGGTLSSVNFRGFGSAQTLVLINGRQAPASNLQLNAGGPQPDINGIPLSAVDRIEVLPSSASGIYGGGAVGGVLNIVLKRNYHGGEVKLNYMNTFDSDAPIRRVDMSYGFSLERGRTQVMLGGSWQDRELLRYQDRLDPLDKYERRVFANEIAAGMTTIPLGATTNIRSSTGVPLTLKGSNTSLGSPFTHVPAGTTASTPAATLAAGLLANAGTFSTERPNTTQGHGGLQGTLGTAPEVKSFMANVRREMTPNVEAFVDFTYSGTRNWRNLSAVTSAGTVPINSPVNPFNQALTVSMPVISEFPVTSNNLSRRITAGVIARLPHDWRAEADYTWTTSSTFYRSTGFLSSLDMAAALTAGTINPFVDPRISPIDLSPFTSVIQFSGGGSKNLVTLRATGPVWRLPAGEPQLAVGVERRRDGLTGGFHTTEFANFPARNIVRYAVGKEQVTWAGYAELNLPVFAPSQDVPFMRALDFQITGRVEDFTVKAMTGFVQLSPPPVGVIRENEAKYQSLNPTFGVRWQPVRNIMVRGSYARGFAPPTYDQLLDNPDPSTTGTNITDPRRGNAIYPVFTMSGGNPDLKPERSRSESAGVILTPPFVKGLRLSVDWVRITKENNITTLPLQQMVENESVFPHRITRGPVPANDAFGVGPITLVDLSSINLLRSFVEAYDVNVSYRRETQRFGTFEASALATLSEHYIRQTALGQPEIDFVNFSTLGPLRRSGHASLTWDYNRWTAGWAVRYIGEYRISGPPASTITTNIVRHGGRTVASQDYHEVFGAYRFPRVTETVEGWRSYFRGVELQVGIRNVFDLRPRMDASNVTYYYSTWGDIRGREYRITLKKAF
jgi:iron complex outermembrane recepter protein